MGEPPLFPLLRQLGRLVHPWQNLKIYYIKQITRLIITIHNQTPLPLLSLLSLAIHTDQRRPTLVELGIHFINQIQIKQWLLEHLRDLRGEILSTRTTIVTTISVNVASLFLPQTLTTIETIILSSPPMISLRARCRQCLRFALAVALSPPRTKRECCLS